jgi:hypothetical protein
MSLLTVALLAYALNEARGDRAVHGVHAAERADVYARMDRRQALGASRSRWLHDHAAEASFPCGVVRPSQEGADDETLAALRGMDLELPVTAAVLGEEVAFLAEPPEASGVAQMIEVGRIGRDALREVEVVDATGARVPEPHREGFESQPVWLVLRWGDGDAADEERFLFRSAWLAWAAARRLRAVRPVA